MTPGIMHPEGRRTERPAAGRVRPEPRVWAGRRQRVQPAPLVLVVEDEAPSRSALCEILRDGGFRVIELKDAEELLRVAAVLQPAAVLMDLVLPQINGIEAAGALKAKPATAGIPLIAATASWLGERADLLAAAGFSAALRKPYRPADLFAAIERVLGEDRGG